MERILSGAKCDYKRFNAVDGRLLRSKEKTIVDYSFGLPVQFNKENYDRFIQDKPGSIGCALSHLIVNEQIAASGSSKPVVVFEDDIKLEKKFVEELEVSLQNINVDWDVILLSSWVDFDSSAPFIENANIKKVGWFLETYSYVVNGAKGAKNFASLISKCPFVDPFDYFLCHTFANHGLKLYGRIPYLCTQYDGTKFLSDIETSNNCKINFYIEEAIDVYLDKLESGKNLQDNLN